MSEKSLDFFDKIVTAASTTQSTTNQQQQDDSIQSIVDDIMEHDMQRSMSDASSVPKNQPNQESSSQSNESSTETQVQMRSKTGRKNIAPATYHGNTDAVRNDGTESSSAAVALYSILNNIPPPSPSLDNPDNELSATSQDDSGSVGSDILAAENPSEMEVHDESTDSPRPAKGVGRTHSSSQVIKVLPAESPPKSWTAGQRVRAVFASHGDMLTQTPAFNEGDVFEIEEDCDNGWIRVADGYLMKDWVKLVGKSQTEISNEPQETSKTFSDSRRSSLSSRRSSIVSRRGSTVIQEIPIQARKVNGSLGFQIAGDAQHGMGVVICKIKEDGPADADGLLRKGDRIIRVGDVDLSSASHEEATKCLQSAPDLVILYIRRKKRLRSDSMSSKKSSQSSIQLRPRTESIDQWLRSSYEEEDDSDDDESSPTSTSFQNKASLPQSQPTIAEEPRSEPSSIASSRGSSVLPSQRNSQLDLFATPPEGVSGWLLKQSKKGSSSNVFKSKSWKKRWFELHDNIIKYYHDKPSSAAKPADGYIVLDASSTAHQVSGLNFVISTSKGNYQLRAETENDVQKWMKAFRQSISRTKSASSA